jgi:hypothetical protein
MKKIGMHSTQNNSNLFGLIVVCVFTILGQYCRFVTISLCPRSDFVDVS